MLLVCSCFEQQYQKSCSSFALKGIFVLKVNLCTSQRSKPSIYVSHLYLDVIDFGQLMFGGFQETVDTCPEQLKGVRASFPVVHI